MKKLFKRALLVVLVLVVIVGAGVGWLGWLLFDREEHEYLAVSEDIRLHYSVEGSGPPVILIHGSGANADLNWRRAGIVDRLAEDFTVVAFDLRGHGLTSKPHDPAYYGMEMVEDIRRIMDHLDIERAHIAGYSLGGFLALKYVTTHPERVASVAFCASGWVDPDDADDILSPYRAAPEEALQHYRQIAGFDPVMFVRETFNDIGDYLIDKQAMKAMKKSLPELVVTREAVKACHTPGILFIGTDDGLLPYAIGLHKLFPGIRYVELDGANHITTAMSSTFKKDLQDFFRSQAFESAEAAAP
jgi:pimeloyl-ACP methyl ester carboxylesterase